MGGIVGQIAKGDDGLGRYVINCYSRVDQLEAKHNDVGGIAGIVSDDSFVINCYSTVEKITANSYSASVVGYSKKGNLQNIYGNSACPVSYTHLIDLGFFNGRLNVIGNWYNSISTDILYKYPISSISGATSTTTNMSGAKIRNRGFDVQLDARLLTGKVNWNFSTNISVDVYKRQALRSATAAPAAVCR